MRLNKFVARATGLSRREADEVITQGRVTVNGKTGVVGQRVSKNDVVAINGDAIQQPQLVYLMLNKPAGYLSSRRSQSAPTVYQLLPEKYRTLKIAGRLDKDTTGLIILTNNGDFANKLTHPRYGKDKLYRAVLNRPIKSRDLDKLARGVELEDGVSVLTPKRQIDEKTLEVSLGEGRNRQIRRTFAALGYEIAALHRLAMGPYHLGDLKPGRYKLIEPMS